MENKSSAQYLLVVLDADLAIQTVNQTLLQRLGFNAFKLNNKPFREILPDERLESLLKKNDLSGLETVLRAKDGQEVQVLLSSLLLRDQKGKRTGVICIAQDLNQYLDQDLEGANAFRRTSQTVAWHDSLTQLPNRQYLYETLHREIETARRHHHSVAVLHITLDRLKAFNDRLGRSAGDTLLISVAQRLNAHVRKEDFVARLSGDEFVIVITHMKDYYDAGTVAKKLLKAMSLPVRINDTTVNVTACIGIAHFPENAVTPDSLIQNAILASHQARELGGNNCKYYTSTLTPANQRHLTLARDLPYAVSKKGLFLDFQPIIEISTGRIVGLEALLRWQHPELGVIPPDEFIPIAEDIRVIHDINEWALHEACSRYAKWKKQLEPDGIRIALNISAEQLENDAFPQTIVDACAQREISPQSFVLELSETALMTKLYNAHAMLTQLRDFGIDVVIDHFGAGYSSFKRLKDLPVTGLKLDRSLIQEVTDDNDSAVVVKSVIELARGLGLNIVAVGVETREQLKFLSEQNCPGVQGDYFCSPMDAKKAAKLLKNFTAKVD